MRTVRGLLEEILKQRQSLLLKRENLNFYVLHLNEIQMYALIEYGRRLRHGIPVENSSTNLIRVYGMVTYFNNSIDKPEIRREVL